MRCSEPERAVFCDLSCSCGEHFLQGERPPPLVSEGHPAGLTFLQSSAAHTAVLNLVDREARGITSRVDSAVSLAPPQSWFVFGRRDTLAKCVHPPEHSTLHTLVLLDFAVLAGADASNISRIEPEYIPKYERVELLPSVCHALQVPVRPRKEHRAISLRSLLPTFSSRGTDRVSTALYLPRSR